MTDINDIILEKLGDVQKTLSALEERTKNFCDIVSGHTNDISTLQIKLNETITDVELLKRDRWWIGTLCSFAGAVIMFIIQFFLR